MRFAFALPLAFAGQALFASAVLADYDASQAWFLELPNAERAAAQAELILLGDYYYLVDGQFGTGTYNALIEFQRSQGAPKTGVLTPAQRDTLHTLADRVRAEFGFEDVRDPAAQVEIAIPRALLPIEEATATGTRWSTSNGGMTVETIYRPSQEQSFAELFAALSQPGRGRIVTSKSFNDNRFVITGHQDGREFYAMYKNTGTASVGYQLTWSLEYAQRGNVLSIYIASNFRPLGSLPPDAGTQKSNAPVARLQFGAFSLPPTMPDVIVLDGEVAEGFYEDWERAIAARPEARVVLLNSPGGYVDSALAVAREVRSRGMATVVGKGMGCYSACSYIFFAGEPRQAEGELGVHQISAEVADLVLAQTTLSDVIDALNKFGVEQTVIVQMLRTPPEDMYVFSSEELSEWGVNRGGPVRIAEVNAPFETPTPIEPQGPGPVADPGAVLAYVHLAQQSNETEAERALKYARDHWASVLGSAEPEIARAQSSSGTVYHIRVPARSVESANSMCAAIKSAGGGCYVTKSGG